MKKYFVGILIVVLLGLTTTVVAFNLTAGTTAFEPNDEDWNVATVEEALNDLYNQQKPVLLWTNPTPTSAFAAQTIEMDLSEYQYIIVVPKLTTSSNAAPQTTVLVKVPSGNEGYSMSSSGSSAWVRKFTVNEAGITFNKATTSSSNSTTTIIPYKIYGIKGDLGLDLGES